jgi:hypothetical protein
MNIMNYAEMKIESDIELGMNNILSDEKKYNFIFLFQFTKSTIPNKMNFDLQQIISSCGNFITNA